MPKNRSKPKPKPKPIQQGSQASQDNSGPSASPEWVEMAGNGGENEIIGSRLSPDHPDSSEPRESPKWVEMAENDGENEIFGSLSSSDHPGSSAEPSASPEWVEMAGNGGENEKSRLSFRQQSALPAIAAAPSIAQAARDSGVSETTLRRWLHEKDFREELINLRQESAELARQELQGLMLTGLSIMAAAMQSPDEPTRIRAARYVLSFGVQIGEAEKLRGEVRKLEDSFALLSARKPVH